MSVIKNPILKGFNPDPSIIRVRQDYYIATSTFEWFPGVQIHHSRDLVNWRLVNRPLNRIAQLNMIGNPDSCGVWAPCLTYDDGTFYLVYSNVRSFDGVWKDTPNYLVTTKDILGDWSDPIYLSSSGFDGSLFHDNNGRKWFTSMIVDHRKGKFFGGIILQEYDPVKQKLSGPVHHIFEGSELGITEAPHIYKLNGYYYVITAEGGTEYGHAVSIARSKDITGPYELHPDNPFITSRDNPGHPLQKAGHADLVETENGDWYAVFLVGRPLSELGRCTLGRETAIEKLEWKNEWPYPISGSKNPQIEVNSPYPEEKGLDAIPTRINFDQGKLDLNFQSLRCPISREWLSLTDRNGFLRLYGRESLSSFHYQSLIARRIQHFNIEASTCLEFEPNNFQQMAGLVCYYNTSHWYYLVVCGDGDKGGKFLNIIACDNFNTSEPLKEPVNISGSKQVFLKVHFENADLRFYYKTTNDSWTPVGPVLDGSILSDDYVCTGSDRYRPAFTGAFVGLCCQDLTGRKLHADFDWFEYAELENH
ncbi:MAG: glycoside hydrolase family 43 protein [Bacteroidota bacterium]